MAVKRLIDAKVRVRKGIPAGHVAKASVGDPTNRYTDAEMRAAVRIVASRARAEDTAKFARDVERYLAAMDRLCSGHEATLPDPPRFPECVIGMRRYESLRDRSVTPSHNSIRRRHGSFHGFVQAALGKE